MNYPTTHQKFVDFIGVYCHTNKLGLDLKANYCFYISDLTLIRVGFLGFILMWVLKLSLPLPSLRHIKIILETGNLVHKYTHIFSFRKYTFYCQDPLDFADVSIFWKNSPFFVKNSTFNQSNSMRAMLEMF